MLACQGEGTCKGLCCVLQRVLRAYAAKLIARLPKTASGGTTGNPGAGTIDWCAEWPCLLLYSTPVNPLITCRASDSVPCMSELFLILSRAVPCLSGSQDRCLRWHLQDTCAHWHDVLTTLPACAARACRLEEV